ncbi:Gfo/Idh/MocA family oxidoreductase [uncultured Litoreibacter sp.]|uniref:Gfo/Idh/MocA family protein n=1 Tax=uncultured Litoreibacter sp. TaxID=1392394 RepID=UPI00262C5E12|nr:Gfo/Idh/MocA family oxidoreductase [uncultured Litoreibacter sp.]
MIRVGILGAGIGAEHLQGYRALPDLFEVVVICDLDEARAKDIAGGTPTTADAGVVFENPQIDLIDVCLPPHLHVPMSLRALEAGKSVICEKPIATSLKDVSVLEKAEAQSGGQIYPVFQYRFGRAMAQLQALGDAGLLGAPQMASLETHWARRADYYTVPWRGTWAGEKGGAVVGHAIHAHDLLSTLFGKVAQVSAVLDTRINLIETEDCAALTFKMRNGALAASSVTLGGADDKTRIKLIYEKLTATSGSKPYAPMDQDWAFQARDPENQAAIDAVVAAVLETGAGFTGYLAEVAAAMNCASNKAVRLADGRASIELITAIYASARSGGAPVTCPVGTDHPLYGGWQPLED